MKLLEIYILQPCVSANFTKKLMMNFFLKRAFKQKAILPKLFLNYTYFSARVTSFYYAKLLSTKLDFMSFIQTFDASGNYRQNVKRKNFM